MKENISIGKKRERRTNRDDKIYVFDLARGIASFLLVLWHYYFPFAIGNPLLVSIAGTAIFYFISGFVITMSFERNSLKKWLIKRFFRLYPTILFVLFISLLIVYLRGEKQFNGIELNIENIIKNTTFLFQFLPFYNKPLTEYLYAKTMWTICVDFTFYILLILTYKICKTQQRRINFIVCLSLFCLISIKILRTKYQVYGAMQHTIKCLFPFYFGMINYYYYKHYITKKHCIILTLFIFTPILFSFHSRYIIGGFVMLYLFTYHKEIGNNKIVKFFANISYPMFLVHAVFPMLIWTNTNMYLEGLNKFYFFILYPAMIPLCYFIYRFIEKPFNDFGRKITAKMK